MLSQWAMGRKSDGNEASRVSGGEGGIRTHGRLRDTRSPGVPDRPLQHLSRACTYYDSLSEPQDGSHQLGHRCTRHGKENGKPDQCLELGVASEVEERVDAEGEDASQSEGKRKHLAGQRCLFRLYQAVEYQKDEGQMQCREEGYASGSLNPSRGRSGEWRWRNTARIRHRPCCRLLRELCAWRRGWDSNPRSACAETAFRERHHEPLGHLSGRLFYFCAHTASRRRRLTRRWEPMAEGGLNDVGAMPVSSTIDAFGSEGTG
jgi:hypothetical protein